MSKFIGALLLVAAVAMGFMPMTGVGGPHRSAAASYTGPGDAVSGADAWYSCFRGYSASYASGTNPGCNLVRASDSHACDVLIKSNGAWGNTANCGTGGDNGQTAASFCNATTCSIPEAYDQTGANFCSHSGAVACNVVQTTAADQPTISFSTGPASGADITCPNTSVSLALAAGTSLGATAAQPTTILTVASPATGISNAPIATVQGGVANSAPSLYFISTTVVQVYAGTAQNVTTTNAWQVLGAVFNAASSNLYVDGSSNPISSPGTNGLVSGNTVTLCADDFVDTSKALIAEVGIWPSGFNSTQAASQSSNAHSFYGF